MKLSQKYVLLAEIFLEENSLQIMAYRKVFVSSLSDGISRQVHRHYKIL